MEPNQPSDADGTPPPPESVVDAMPEPIYVRSDDYVSIFSDNVLISYSGEVLRLNFSRTEVNHPHGNNYFVQEAGVHMTVRQAVILVDSILRRLKEWKDANGQYQQNAMKLIDLADQAWRQSFVKFFEDQQEPKK